MTKRALLPVAATAAVLLAGCGGSSSPSSSPVHVERSGSANASVTAAASASPRPGGAAPAGTSGAAAAQTGGTTTSTGAATTTSTGADSGDGEAAADATAPGTYTYDTSGTVTAGTPRDASGTAALTVDPPAGGRQHSVLANDQGRTEQVVVVRPDGTYLVSLSISNPAFSKEFRPAAPVLLVPEPATAGRTWSWTATSTDGKTTVAVTAKVSGHETLTVGGAPTATTVVQSTLRLTGDVTYTAQMQTWYDTSHRLIAKEHTKGSGTYGGLQFTTDITTVLRSTEPA